MRNEHRKSAGDAEVMRTLRRDLALGMLLVLVFTAGVVGGYWLKGSVEASSRIVVADAEPLPPPPCGDRWYVTVGDTAWDIAERCFPGEHTGKRASEILALNDVSAGGLRFGDELRLPERGGERWR